LDAVYEATDGKTTIESVEIAIVGSKTKKFKKLTDDEIIEHVEELLLRKPKETDEEEEEE